MLYFLYTILKANLSRKNFLFLAEIFRNRYATACGALCELLRLSPCRRPSDALNASAGFLQSFTAVMLPKQPKRQSAIDFLGISSLRELFQFLYCTSHGLHFCNQGIAGGQCRCDAQFNCECEEGRLTRVIY